MKKIFLIAFLALTGTIALLTAEGGAEFSGNIKTKWGVGAPWTDEDYAADRFTLADTSFTGKLDAFYGNSTAYAEATLSYDAVGALTGNGYGSGNLGHGFDLSVGELWVDYTESFWGIRIGRQKAAWGKADGIDIANVICPSDMSSLSAMTGDDSKLAIDSLRLSLTGNQFTADAWWIPFFTPSALPLNEGNSLRKFLVPESIDYPLPSMNTTLTIPVSIGNIETPSVALWNSEFGLKVSGYLSALDLSLYGFYGWDDTPFLDYTMSFTPMPSALTLSGQYKRMAMIGADAALPIGETVLRLEAAFFPQRHFQKKAEKIIEEKMKSSDVEITEKRNQISALAGIDWMPSGWTLTAQYYLDLVMGDLDPLDREDAYQHGATLSLSKSLVNETLELSLSGLLGFNDFDSMISPSIKYSLSDQINLCADAFIFIPGPDRDGKYGAYKDLSSLCISAEFSF